MAIAPVDGQYRPSDKPTPLSNYNYFLIHGSHDGDVSTFSGLAQYERIRFTDGQPRFKAAIWVYRANHGQWNTVWGNKDNGPRSGRVLDLRGLLPPEDQRRFAEVYITAFLEATLNGRHEYLPMFRDHRVVGALAAEDDVRDPVSGERISTPRPTTKKTSTSPPAACPA